GLENIATHIKSMINDGASIIDVGAYSSRPGAKHISQKEELERLLPTLELILKHFPDIIVSVDTFRSEIAKIVAEDYNVSMINDISSGDLDKKMFETIASLNIPYIIMHMKGSPQDMQLKAEYEDLMKEIINYFSDKTAELKKLGVHDVIIDPGFGFGKTLAHNYQILNNLHELNIFEVPILVGLSRKSMIYKLLGISPEEALNGTSVLNTICINKGASILRVHDVKAACEVINLTLKTIQS
ncbi:MAG: dihydropteroate synthase, partial [Bacteroidales bacterium]|nr:dihydropteroate synthase [Bacteroidales bacterium]